MYYISLLVCLGIGGVGWVLRHRSAALSRVCLALSVIGCIGLFASEVFRTLGGGGTPQMHRGQAAAGYVLAHEFLGDTRERSGKVVLIFPPDQAAPAAALDSFYEAFARAMTRFPGIEVEDRVVSTSVRKAKRGQVSLEEFRDVVAEQDNVLAFVSWVGLPLGVESLSTFKDRTTAVPLYVLDPWDGRDWLPLVQSGTVQAGVLPLPEAERGSPTSPTPGAIFAANFVLVTAENVDEIPQVSSD